MINLGAKKLVHFYCIDKVKIIMRYYMVCILSIKLI